MGIKRCQEPNSLVPTTVPDTFVSSEIEKLQDEWIALRRAYSAPRPPFTSITAWLMAVVGAFLAGIGFERYAAKRRAEGQLGNGSSACPLFWAPRHRVPKIRVGQKMGRTGLNPQAANGDGSMPRPTGQGRKVIRGPEPFCDGSFVASQPACPLRQPAGRE